jgi:serine O-acetyltransferase
VNFLWRIAHHLYCLGGTWKKCARVFEIVSFVIASNAISAQAVIGKGTQFYHHGLGCVVHENVVIGVNCKIFQNVTLGAKLSEKESGDKVPTVGDGVMIGAGAVLLGDIHIGNHATIGANAVIVSNVPEYAVVVGVPGRIRG